MPQVVSLGGAKIDTSGEGRRGFPQAMVRVLGAILLLFGFFPIFRAFDLAEEAIHRRGLVEVAEAALQFTWWGSLLVFSLGIVLAVLFSGGAIRWGRPSVRC